jgi:hypothetical protein
MSNEESKEVGVETPIDVVSFPFRNIKEEEIELDLGSSKFNFLLFLQIFNGALLVALDLC